MESVATNPLSRAALQVPRSGTRLLSLAGRALGAGLAAAVAVDQSYDPTQVFVVVIAALVLTTLVPLAGAAGDWAAAFGGGLVFFAGTLLTHLGFGVAMLLAGAVAALGALALAHREGRDTTLPALAFLGAVFLVAALQVVVVFSFE